MKDTQEACLTHHIPSPTFMKYKSNRIRSKCRSRLVKRIRQRVWPRKGCRSRSHARVNPCGTFPANRAKHPGPAQLPRLRSFVEGSVRHVRAHSLDAGVGVVG